MIAQELKSNLPHVRFDYRGFNGKEAVYGLEFGEAMSRCRMGSKLRQRGRLVPLCFRAYVAIHGQWSAHVRTRKRSTSIAYSVAEELVALQRFRGPASEDCDISKTG